MTRISFKLFLFAIIVSPLAFGAVEPWSLFIMEITVLLSVSMIIFQYLRRKKTLPEIPGLIPLTVLLFYIGFQLIPLPPAVVELLSPGTYSLYTDTVWVGDPARWVSLSINKKAGLAELFRFSSYAGIYILSVLLLVRPGLFRKTVIALAVFGSFLAFFAILQHLASNDKIYWLRELTLGGSPFGPYVNRNHYAGLMGMIFPMILCLFIYYRPELRNLPFRERLADLFTHPRSNVSVLLGFSTVLVATSIFLSLSRGGIASLGMTVIFLGLLLAKKPGQNPRGLIVAAMIIITLYAVGWFGWEPVFERFQSIRNYQGEISELRLDIWKDSLNIIRDFPLTGTGFGSYIKIYPSYRTIDTLEIADHAHNDYLELLTNGGIIAAFLLAWFMFIVLKRSYSAFRRRRDPFSTALFSGILAGIFSILLHSITDFNLQIGANGLYLFLLLGMAVSASHTKFQAGGGTMLKSMSSLRANRLAGFAFVTLLLLCFSFYAGRLSGAFLYSEVRDIPLDRSSTENLMTVSHTLARASLFDSLEPQYYYHRARAEALAMNIPMALKSYRSAVALDPANSINLQSLGLFLSKKVNGGEAEAEILLRSATVRDRKNPDARKRYAGLLLRQDKRDKGIEIFREAVLVAPSRTRESIAAMVLAGLTDEEIRSALPEQADAYVVFANYLDKTGKNALASEIYTTALSLPVGKGQNPAAPYNAVFSFHMKKQDFAGAAAVMRRAVGIFPEDVGMKLKLAEAYEKMKQKNKALEQYRAILKLDPKNARAEKKIRELS